MFDLNNFELLTESEMQEIEGGNWWSDFKQGFKSVFEFIGNLTKSDSSSSSSSAGEMTELN